MKCNLCKYEGPFMPMGTRKNARCPNCKSLERHRDIVKHLKLSGDVLHISPNAGLARYLKAQDINYEVSYVENGGYDIQKPLKNTYDNIICLHVVEHIEDDKAAFKNLNEALNEKGVLWLQIPFEKTPSKEIGHKKSFTEKGLKNKLTRAGFKTEVLDKRHKFFKCEKLES